MIAFAGTVTDEPPKIPPAAFDAPRWLAFVDAVKAIVEFVDTLKSDFFATLGKATWTDEGADARAIIRAFGPLMDGCATSMRSLAVAAAHAFNRELNPFLQEKVTDRTTSNYHRMVTNYRLIAEFLPGSPLAQVPDSRWKDTLTAIEIRNRIVHPASVADLQVSDEEFEVISKLALSLCKDFQQFWVWFEQKGQKLLWQQVSQRRRLVPKLRRNAPCSCGSQVKYKQCCGESQNVKV